MCDSSSVSATKYFQTRTLRKTPENASYKVFNLYGGFRCIPTNFELQRSNLIFRVMEGNMYPNCF